MFKRDDVVFLLTTNERSRCKRASVLHLRKIVTARLFDLTVFCYQLIRLPPPAQTVVTVRLNYWLLHTGHA